MNQDLISIKNISRTAHDKDIHLMEIKTKIKCHKEGTAKMKMEIEHLRLQISKLNIEIARTKPINEILSKAFESWKETLELSQNSKHYVDLYNIYAKKELQEVHFKQNQILDKWTKLYDNTKKQLENSSKKFKEYQQCKSDLKLTKIKCLDFKQKIAGLKKKQLQSLEIKRSLFNKDIIKMAEAWLRYDKCLNAEKILKECKVLEKKCLRDLLNAQDLVRKNWNSNVSYSNIYLNNNMNINKEQSSSVSNNDLSKKFEVFNKQYTPMVFKEPKLSIMFDSNKKVRILSDTSLIHTISKKSYEKSAIKKDLLAKQVRINNNLDKLHEKYKRHISRHNSNESVKSTKKSEDNQNVNRTLAESQEKSFNESQISMSCENALILSELSQPATSEEKKEMNETKKLSQNTLETSKISEIEYSQPATGDYLTGKESLSLTCGPRFSFDEQSNQVGNYFNEMKFSVNTNAVNPNTKHGESTVSEFFARNKENSKVSNDTNQQDNHIVTPSDEGLFKKPFVPEMEIDTNMTLDPNFSDEANLSLQNISGEDGSIGFNVNPEQNTNSGFPFNFGNSLGGYGGFFSFGS